MTCRPRSGLLIAAALAMALSASLALAQASPVGGNIRLTLSPSTVQPAPASTMTVDLSINMSAATGTCASTRTSTPLVLGGYALALAFDPAKLQFVSAARCPSTHIQIANPSCNETTRNGVHLVACGATTAKGPDHPRGGPICVVRFTFTNVGLATGEQTTLQTIHTLPGAPLGIGSDYVSDSTACGGAVAFPKDWMVDDVVGLSGGR